MSHEDGQRFGQEATMPEGIDLIEKNGGPQEPPKYSVPQPGKESFTHRLEQTKVQALALVSIGVTALGLGSGGRTFADESPDPTPTTHTYRVNLPVALDYGIIDSRGVPTAQPTQEPTDPIPNTPEPTITPTPEEPTPTPEIEQKPVEIKPDAKIALSDSALPKWSLGYVLDTDGKVDGMPVSQIKDSKGTVISYVIEVNGTRGIVDANDIVDPTKIKKVDEFKEGDIKTASHILVNRDEPMEINQFDGNAFGDGMIEVPNNNKNFEYSLDFNLKSGISENEIADYYSNIRIYSKHATISISPRQNGRSFVAVTLAQPDNTGKIVYKGYIGGTDDKDMSLVINSDRKSFKIEDKATGQVVTPYSKEAKNSSIPNTDNEWTPLPNGSEMGGSDVWQVGYIGSVLKNSTTVVNSLSFHSRRSNYLDLKSPTLKKELEADNGLAKFSDSESMSIGVAVSITGSPNIGHFLKENVKLVNFNGSNVFIPRGMGGNNNQLEENAAQKAAIQWLRNNKIPFVPGLNVLEVYPGIDTRRFMDEYIKYITSLNPGQTQPINDLFDPKSGDYRKDLPWAIKNYNAKPESFARDFIGKVNENGAAVDIVLQKSTKAAADTTFGKIRGLKTEGNIHGVILDIGGMTYDQANELITKYQDAGIEVTLGQVAGNTDGMSLEDQLQISFDKGLKRELGTPEKPDATKIYAIESTEDNGVSSIRYTDIYEQYRAKLAQTLATRGKR